MAKVIDNTNLGYLLGKIKAAFWRKSETTELPIDATPTASSNNLVKSGGVYAALATKANSSDIPALVETPVASTQPSGGFLPNVIYDLGEVTGSVTFALATPTDNTIANTYVWTFETGSTAPTVAWPSNLTWLGGNAPTINTGKHYEITIRKGYANCLEF